MRTITISVTRTIQVERFEPVGVTVTESIEIKDTADPAEARKKLYSDVTKQVTSYVENEKKKYGKKKAQRDDEDD